MSEKGKGLPVARHVGINVTPMIDLMMCLIIFFMLAAKIAMDDNDKEVILPKINHVKKIGDDERKDHRLTVNILPADPRNADPKKRPLRFVVRGEEFSLDKLENEMRVSAARAKELSKNFRLVLRPSGNVIYGDIQEVLYRASITKVPEVLFAAAELEKKR